MLIRLAALSGVILLVGSHMQSLTAAMFTVSYQTIPASSAQQSKPRRSEQGCHRLKPGQAAESVVSNIYPACFLTAVAPGEGIQVKVSQPEDMEIHVRSEAVEKLVDGFDMGNETITLIAPGSYRIEVSEVQAFPGVLTVFASARRMELQQAAAWTEAERWATMSKRSRKIESVNQSLSLWTKLDDASSVARTYLKRESILRPDDALAARADAEKALVLCRAIPDTRCSAEAANNSGVSSRKLSDVDNASLRFAEAARDFGELHDSINEAVTRSNLGILLWQCGEFERAIRELDLAERTLRGRDKVRYANVLNSLGLYYQSLAEYEKAEGYFERAIAGFNGGKNPKELVRARLNLGRTYMLEGHATRAQALLEQVLAEARNLSDRRAISDALRNLGQTLWNQGNAEQARTQLEEALAMDRLDHDRRGQSSALHYMGLAAQHDGDPSAARDFLTEAIKIRQESGLRDEAAESLSALANLEYGQGNLDAARADAEQALKLLESVRSHVPNPTLRASFYTRKRQFFDLLVDMAMSPGTAEANVEGLLADERGRARALMDLLADGALMRQLPPDLAERRRSIQRQIDFLAYRISSIPPEQQDEIRRRIERLIAEDEEVEAQIRQSVAGQKSGWPLSTIEPIQQDYLPPNSALLEFHLGARKSYLWVVDTQHIRAYTLPPAAAIEAQAAPVVNGFGRILERRRSPARQQEFLRASQELSATLLGQLSHVPLPQLLILVPDGILHRVPFAALDSPDVSTPLGLIHDLVQVPSAAYLAFGRPPRAIKEFHQSIVAMVDPIFSRDDPRVPIESRQLFRSSLDLELPRLPFTGEVNTIESLVPPGRRKIFRGFDASRATLNTLKLSDFGVLHFSTHALIDDQIPELSRLALSMVNRAGHPVDGFLRPYQLAQLHLDGSTIVLSACDTALGKQVLGEGIAGLTSALLYAGGAQLVLTLTKIDAEASARYLSRVYSSFLSGSTNMEHAMTLTRRAMAQEDPYYWASWIVVGLPASAKRTQRNMLSAAYNTE